MTVIHIIGFAFAQSTTNAQINEVIVRFFALKEECLHSVTKEPYINSITGGTSESKEGLQGGITHVFMIEFVSAADRDYYVNSDPAPQRFKELVKPLINGEAVRILDFKPMLFKEKSGGSSESQKTNDQCIIC